MDCPLIKESIPVVESRDVARVGADLKENRLIAGQVNGKQCRIFLDTGADVSVLPQSLVAAHADLVGSITLKPFSKQNDGMADLVTANI